MRNDGVGNILINNVHIALAHLLPPCRMKILNANKGLTVLRIVPVLATFTLEVIQHIHRVRDKILILALLWLALLFGCLAECWMDMTDNLIEALIAVM